MPVSVSCFCHVTGEDEATACLCQFLASATLREKEEILYACVSFLLRHVNGEGGDQVAVAILSQIRGCRGHLESDQRLPWPS